MTTVLTDGNGEESRSVATRHDGSGSCNLVRQRQNERDDATTYSAAERRYRPHLSDMWDRRMSRRTGVPSVCQRHPLGGTTAARTTRDAGAFRYSRGCHPWRDAAFAVGHVRRRQADTVCKNVGPRDGEDDHAARRASGQDETRSDASGWALLRPSRYLSTLITAVVLASATATAFSACALTGLHGNAAKAVGRAPASCKPLPDGYLILAGKAQGRRCTPP